MSKFSNLYDIDGNIINKSPQHTYTLEECEKLVDDLTKKVEENPDNEVYRVYLNNAQKWLMHMYDGMSRQDLMKRISFLTDSIQNAKDTANEAEQKQLDEINKVMEEFKKQYDNDTIMDEYVEPIEEIKEDETDKEDIRPLHSGEPEADETGSTE
jgi:AAA+ ATPase superfamily predicted ATPase